MAVLAAHAPATRKVPIANIDLPAKVVRSILEKHFGEQVFRMTINDREAAAVSDDWTLHRLSDGRWAVWRPVSNLPSRPWLRAEIEKRCITDDQE